MQEMKTCLQTKHDVNKPKLQDQIFDMVLDILSIFREHKTGEHNQVNKSNKIWWR